MNIHLFRISERRIFLRSALDSSGKTGGGFLPGGFQIFAEAGSLWSDLFPPSPPPSVVRSCSKTSPVLQVCPTSPVRSSSATCLDFPTRPGHVAPGEQGISRFPCEVSLYVHGVFDRAGPRHTSRYRCAECGLPLLLTASASRSKFLRGWIPGPYFPCQRFDASLTSGSA